MKRLDVEVAAKEDDDIIDQNRNRQLETIKERIVNLVATQM